MAKMVGLSRNLKLSWLNQAVELVSSELTENEIKEKLTQIAITSWTPSTRQSSCRFGQVHLQRLHPGFGIPEFFSEDSYTRSRYLRFVGL